MKCFHTKCISNLNFVKCCDDITFYSNSGVFSLRNNKIYRHIYCPKHIETLQLDDMVLYKDHSTVSYKEIFSQIPSDYDIIKYKKYMYSVKEQDNILFVVVFKDCKLFDCYIETSNGLDNMAMKSTVLSFLSQ